MVDLDDKKLEELSKVVNGELKVDMGLIVTGDPERPYMYSVGSGRVEVRVDWDRFMLIRDVRGDGESPVLRALPVEVEVLDRPIGDDIFSSLYSIRYRSLRGDFFVEAKPLPDHLLYLKNNAFMSLGVGASNTILEFLFELLSSSFVVRRKSIGVRGVWFDFDSESVVVEDPTHAVPSPDDVVDGLRVLTGLLSFYPPDEACEVLRWFVSAPFGFIRKQLLVNGEGVEPVPILYLYGSSRSGKTTLLRSLLSMYHPPGDVSRFAQSGASAMTVYGVGRRLSETTYPQLLDEAAGSFNNRTEEIWKSAVMSLEARRVFRQSLGEEVVYPAYSTIAVTSNDYNVGYSEALSNRMLEVELSESYGDEDLERFSDFMNNVFDHELIRMVGCMVVGFVVENPDVLFERDWRVMGDRILRGVGLEEWVPGAFDDKGGVVEPAPSKFGLTVTSLFYEFLFHMINKYRFRSYMDSDEEGRIRSQPIYTMGDIISEYNYILSRGLVPGLGYSRPYNKATGKVKVTLHFLREFEKWAGVRIESLNELSRHLRDPWEYGKIRVGDIVTTGISAPLDDVVNTLITLFHTNEAIPEATGDDDPLQAFTRGVLGAGDKFPLSDFITAIEDLSDDELEEIKEGFDSIDDPEVFKAARGLLKEIEENYPTHTKVKGVLYELTLFDNTTHASPDADDTGGDMGVVVDEAASGKILRVLEKWNDGSVTHRGLADHLLTFPDDLRVTEECKDTLLNVYMKRGALGLPEADLIELEDKLRRWLDERI